MLQLSIVIIVALFSLPCCVCVCHTRNARQMYASMFLHSTSSFNFPHFPPFSNAGMLWLIATLFSRFVLLFPVSILHVCVPFHLLHTFRFFIRPVVHTALDFNVSIKSDASASCYHCRSCLRRLRRLRCRRHRRRRCCCFHCRLIVIIVTCTLAIYSRKFHVCVRACACDCVLHI